MVVIDELALLEHAFLVHEVILGSADMGVGSDGEATARVVDLLVHDHHIVLREALMVEFTILSVLSILRVEPEDVDWEAELGEIVVALNDLVSRVLLPLGKVVSKRVSGWHRSVSCQLSKLLRQLFGRFLGAKKVELKSVALRDEGRVGLEAFVGWVHKHEGLR